MLNSVSDIQNEVLVRLNASTTTTFITDQMLNDWTRASYKYVSAYRKWPFTEGRASTTYASLVTNEDGDLRGDLPEGWKADSIRLMYVGGERMEKISYQDFRKFRDDFPDDDEKLFTDFGREYYINPSADASGTVVVWGQYTPALDPTDTSATTVFSTNDEEGNEAIVYEMMSYAEMKRGNMNAATYYHQKCLELMEGMWKRYIDEQAMYLTKDRHMFKRFDVLEGAQWDEVFKRDQF